MRRLRLLAGFVVASAILSAHAKPVPADRAAAASSPDESAIIPDDAVMRELLRHTSGLPESEIRESLRPCDGNTSQMKLCAAYRWTVQDMRLNRVDAKALAAAKDGTSAALLKAQRAWLAYRDAECAFEGVRGAGGGTWKDSTRWPARSR